ncbi:MAG: HAMP domain-containing histidine kinase [Bdellovibrionales bacterium]|nr:HAMP domain-containing histidine kinase [Bdellovibrionales bacterium]
MKKVLSSQASPDPKLVEINEKMIKMVQRITHIISSMKTLARDGSRDQYEPVDLNEIVNDTLGVSYEKFKSKGVNIVFEPSHAGYFVNCRKTEISQVLVNLLNNAFDVVRDDAEPWVKISFTESESSNVKILVSNSGPKISSELHQKIMQPFFTTKKVGEGTGLGLSISKTIIENHQGEFYLQDETEYTTFVIELPLFNKAEISKFAS